MEMVLPINWPTSTNIYITLRELNEDLNNDRVETL